MTEEQATNTDAKFILSCLDRISILEKALDARQQVYDKLLDDYTKLLAKRKNPKIKVEMALDELRKQVLDIRTIYDGNENHHNRFASGIEHAISTIEDYLGDVLK